MKCFGFASEHAVYDPKNKEVIDDYIRDVKSMGYVYIGYAWFNESGEHDGTEIPIAVICNNKGNDLTQDPCWNWIKKQRTKEQQQWIEDNWDAIVDCWEPFK